VIADEIPSIPLRSNSSGRPPRVQRRRQRRISDRIADRLFLGLTGGAAYLVFFTLAAAALSMAWGGRLAFHTFGWSFFTSTEWDAVAHKFSALVPIWGTIVTAIIAIVIAVPVALGVSIFLTEIAPPWLRGPVGTAIELLAAIPSIIYGMWGLFVFVPFMAEHIQPWMIDHLGTLPGIGRLFDGAPIGIGMLTAGIILGIMIIPFITAVMRDVFLATPTVLKESAFALGATRWEVIKDIVLPNSRTATIGAIFLGLGRALGETMAVTFVLGNAHEFNLSLMQPGNSIAAAIANEFTEADSDIYLSSLIALGFILFVLTFVILALARLLLHATRREGAMT